MAETRNTSATSSLISFVALIGAMLLVVSIMLPSMNRGFSSPRCMQCMSNMRTIATFILIYANENDGYILPDMEVLATEEYCGNLDQAQCSGNCEDVSPGWDYIISAAGKMDDFPDPARNLMVWELPRNHFQTSVNCGFVDGRVESIQASDFDGFVRSLQDANNLLAKFRNQPEGK